MCAILRRSVFVVLMGGIASGWEGSVFWEGVECCTVECGYAGIWGREAVLVGFISLMFEVGC